MFGPSERCLGKYGYAHHRSKVHAQMVRDTQDLFREKFSIPNDMAILFVNGCGTLANEIVIASWRGYTLSWGKGEFLDRLKKLTENHCRPVSTNAQVIFGVGYETARSEKRDGPGNPEQYADRCFVFEDCVSAFPYYDPWQEADVWTTVCGKQLGCDPGLAVIVASNDFCHECAGNFDAGSCLSLWELYHSDGGWKESPHTPASTLILELQNRLVLFNLAEHRARIDARRAWLTAAIPPEQIMGEGPVFTIKHGLLSDDFIEQWGMYHGAYGPQLFLHWGRDALYKEFCCSIKKEMK